MTSQLILCHTSAEIFIFTLPDERDAPAWHAVLTAEIAKRLSRVHAALFARPLPRAVGYEWTVPGQRAMPMHALTLAQQAALRAALGRMLGDLETLAHSGNAPLLASVWPHLRRIPSEEFVFAVDGRPVLAAWAHTPAMALVWPDPLAPLMPPPSMFVAEPSWRLLSWRPIAAFLTAAFVIGLVLPRLFVHRSICHLPPGVGDIARAGAQATELGGGLADKLAQLQGQFARQRTQCPNDLPADKWDKGDLTMLKGCWHLVTDLTLYGLGTHEPRPVATWVICFDETGTGSQTVTFKNGNGCSGPVRASFSADHQLVIIEPRNCMGAYDIVLGLTKCTRVSDGQAQCVRQDQGYGNGTSKGTFQR